MKTPEGERLDDALALILDHSWREHMPVLSVEQLAELLPVLEPWFREEFAPKTRAPKPVQKIASRATPKVDKGSEHVGRRVVKERSGGLCEIEVEGVCAGAAREWQHRKNRSQQGTWHPSNGLHACSPCHQWIHANPRTAVFNGWTVPSWMEPAALAVLRRGVLVLLHDDGSVEPVESEVA